MPHNNNHTYEFGPYRLDPGKRILTRAGETIALTPKATDLLIMLVAHAGQLLDKDELLREIWPDTFVEEANLTQNVFLLRRALGHERAGQSISRRLHGAVIVSLATWKWLGQRQKLRMTRIVVRL